MAVHVDQIGKYNKQLVLDLKAGNGESSGVSITEWRHPQAYNYDLSYGVMACGNNSKRLQGRFVGIKYYCADKSFEWDMSKRIVHIYDQDNKAATQQFYRLIHTSGSPGLTDNSYSNCDLITNIP